MNFKDYLITQASYFRQPAKRKLIKYCSQFRSKKGLEIGGPSSLFSLKGYFPVYLFAQAIDGVNYSNETIWEGRIAEGPHYRYYTRTGYQYIREATDLTGIPSEEYDFVLSCHSLEHVANPLKALTEWNRVLKPGGLLVLVLPDKRFTFDVNRPYTTMEHLLGDYQQDKGEDDTTHFEEILALHELGKDEGTASRQALAERISANLFNRCVHHHVFHFELVNEVLSHTSFTPLYQQAATPFHLVTIAQKKP